MFFKPIPRAGRPFFVARPFSSFSISDFNSERGGTGGLVICGVTGGCEGGGGGGMMLGFMVVSTRGEGKDFAGVIVRRGVVGKIQAVGTMDRVEG